MTDSTVSLSKKPRLAKAGVARMITVVLTLVVTAGIFFIAAGTVDVLRAWVYYGGLVIYLVVAMAVIFVRFPEAIETVNARGKMHEGVKTWDKLFGLAYTVLLLIGPAVAGWDVGRLQTPKPPVFLSAPALIVTILAYAFVHWAMVVNRHAETGVRLQEDRQHQVVSAGPYRIVRHPFYISLIVTQLLYPLAVGSWLAFVPGVFAAALFVWRTAREDDTLRRELDGYEAFTQRTRHRLVPGLW